MRLAEATFICCCKVIIGIKWGDQRAYSCKGQEIVWLDATLDIEYFSFSLISHEKYGPA